MHLLIELILLTELNAPYFTRLELIRIDEILSISNELNCELQSATKKSRRSTRCAGSALTVAVVAIVFLSCQLPLWGWQYIDIIDSLAGTNVKVGHQQ